MSQNIDYSKGIYDARQLGAGRMLILGVQHMFAMFGATVLVPLLTGLSVSTTLLCAGLGTLLFHFITKGKVPAFLGSSFAYLGGFSIVAPMLADADGNLTIANTQMLPYACAAWPSRVWSIWPSACSSPPSASGASCASSRRWSQAPSSSPSAHPRPLGHQQLSGKLAAGLCGSGYGHRLQHLGQGHGQDPAHPDRRSRLLRSGPCDRCRGL